jgi:hypothetical protein
MHTRQVAFLKLDGLDIKKEFDKMMETWGPISKLAQEEIIVGHEGIKQNVLNMFPKYKGLERYNVAFFQKSYTTNTHTLCVELSKYLEEKQQNCKVLYNREIESFIFSEEEGKKHLITGVKLRG